MSIEYKLNALKQTWTGVLTDVISRDSFKGTVDNLTSISEALGGVISKIGLLKTAIIGIGTVIGSQKLGLIDIRSGINKNGWLGSSGLGGMIRNANAYKAEIQSLTAIKKDLSLGLDFSKYNLTDETSVKIKGLTSESRTLLQTWQKDGATTEQAIANINNRIATLGKTSSKVTQYIANIGNTLLNGFVSLGISAAISVVISAINSLANSYKNMVKELSEATSKYTDSKKELQEYSREIETLRDKLDDEASTTEEVEQATSKLYEIQNKLVSTYGGMASGIDLVNGKLETQLGIINEIDKKNYQQWQNEVTSNKSAKSAAVSVVSKIGDASFAPLYAANLAKDYYNFTKGLFEGEGLGNAFKNSFGGENIFGTDYGLELVGNQLEEARKDYENFNKTIKATDNKKVNELIDSFDEFSVVGDKIEISGRVDKVADSLERLQVELRNCGYENAQLDKELSKTAKKARDTTNKLSDTYAQDTYGEIIQSKELLELYYQLEGAYEDYQKAIESGDQKEIDKSVNALKRAINKFETSDIEAKYKDYFEALYPDIQNYISDWKLEVEIVPKIKKSDLEDFLKDHSTEEIIAEYNKYIMQGADYLDPGGYEQFFTQLEIYANDLGVDVDQLILRLHELSQFSYSANLEKIKDKNAKSKDYNTPTKTSSQYFDNGVKKYGNFGGSDEFVQTTGEALDSAIDSWYHKLDTEMQEAFDDLDLSDEEIDVLLSFTTDADRDQWLYDMLHDGEKEVKIKATLTSDLVSDLDALEDKMDSLSTAYESAVTNATYVGASDLQDVNDDFGGIRDDDGNYTAMAAALEKYNDDLTQNVGKTEIARQSTNELLTSYLDLSGTLDDLIEEGEEYAKQVLKDQGVENAEDVVTSRLNKTYKTTRANLVKLAEAMDQETDSHSKYLDVLQSGIRSGKDFDDVCDGLVDSVRELVAVYNQETGEVVGNFNDIIDAKFVEANIEDIIGAFTGVEGSLDNLYNKVAQIRAEKVLLEAGLDTSEVNTKMDSIKTMLDIASTWTMEPEALLENEAFMQALNDCWDGSVETANAINAALSTIGIKAEYKKTGTTDLTVPKAYTNQNMYNMSGAGASKVGNATKLIDTEKISVDNFELTTSSTGKGTTGKNATYGGSSSPSSGGSGGSGDSGSDDSEETFDWNEVAIDRLENNLDKLSETIDNTYDNWESRNKAITNSIDEVNKEIELQKSAAERYLAEAESIDLSEEYKKKVREGKLDIETIKNDDDLVDAINNYQTWWEKYQDAMDKSKTLTLTIQEYYKTLFDNVATQYDQLLDNISKKTETIDEKISRMEEHGYFVDENYYKDQQTLEKDNNKKLIEKREALIKRLNDAVEKGTIKVGSEAWQEMYNSIQDANKAVEESNTNLVKLANSIRQLKWDKFDFIQEKLADINEEATFLQDLLAGTNQFKNNVTIKGDSKKYSNGEFSNAGTATAALTVSRYEQDLRAATNYKREINKINDELKKEGNKNDQNLINRKQELIEKYRESIKAAYEEKQAIKSLVEQAFQKHLESLQKIIDKYSEMLNSAKDLYDYQKNINDQTKNLARLQKQLAAYENDNSEGARKKRVELQKQVNDAQQNLQETQWDRYISETTDALNKVYEDYENYLDEKLEKVDELLNNIINEVNGNPEKVAKAFQEIYKEWGLDDKGIQYFDWNKTENMGGQIATGFKDAFKDYAKQWETTSTAIGQINANLSEVLTRITNSNNNGNGNTAINEKNSNNSLNINENKNTSKGNSSEYKDSGESKATSGTPGGNHSDYSASKDETANNKKTPKNGWLNSVYYSGGKKSTRYVKGRWMKNATGSWYRYYDKNTKQYLDYKDKTVFIDGYNYYINKQGYVDPSKTKAVAGYEYLTKKKKTGRDAKASYATGTRRVPSNQNAWTQEQGSELIYRTTDGAILTPLNQGDMVFTNEMSQRLWEIAKGAIPTGSISTPRINTTINSGDANVNAEISITLPNVQNYNEFKKELQNDNNFEKFVQEITIGQLNGNNKLNKRKY